jgi:hypothetical protein
MANDEPRCAAAVGRHPHLSTQIVVLNSLRLLRYQPALPQEQQPEAGAEAGAGERR